MFVQIEFWNSRDLTQEERDILNVQAAIAGFNADISKENRHFLRDVLSVHHVIDLRRSQLEDMKGALRDHGIIEFLGPKRSKWSEAFPTTGSPAHTAAGIKAHVRYEGTFNPEIVAAFEEAIDELEQGNMNQMDHRQIFLQNVRSDKYA